MSFTLASLKEEIKADLGYPTVKVEIDDSVYQAIVNKALRWFKAKKGWIKYLVVPVVDGQTEYPWPTDATAIVNCILPRQTDVAQLISLGFFDSIPANIIGGQQFGATTKFDITGYVQLLQTLEMRRNVFSADPDWIDLGPSVRKVVITTSTPFSSTGGIYMVMVYKTENMTISDFIGRDEDLFYRYCLARAKLILGTIRAKYGSYPAAGGPISMDGDALKQEAFAEMALLDEEIIESQGNAGGIMQG